MVVGDLEGSVVAMTLSFLALYLMYTLSDIVEGLSSKFLLNLLFLPKTSACVEGRNLIFLSKCRAYTLTVSRVSPVYSARRLPLLPGVG